MHPHTILASFADVPADFIKNILMITGATIGIAVGIVALWNGIQKARNQGKSDVPQPLMVAFEKEFTTRDEHRELKGRVTGLEAKIEKVDEDRRASVSRAYKHFESSIEKIRDDVKEDNNGLHRRLDGLAETLATLVGEVKHLTK